MPADINFDNDCYFLKCLINLYIYIELKITFNIPANSLAAKVSLSLLWIHIQHQYLGRCDQSWYNRVGLYVMSFYKI